jgi:hypothetical protein
MKSKKRSRCRSRSCSIPSNHQRHSREFQGRTVQYYAIPYRDHYIWGATAGMLVNLYRHLAAAKR